MDNEYVPVPTSVAKAISDLYHKSVVIIFAHDPVHGVLHTTTYGRGPQEKAWAAQGAEIASVALGAAPPNDPRHVEFEDYRLKQAKNLQQALRDLVDWVKIDLDGTSTIVTNAEQALLEAKKFLGD